MKEQRQNDKGLDASEFRDIFNRYWNLVYKICYFHVQNESEAADLCQDIFSMVWRKRHLLKNDGQLHHYLGRSAKLEALQYNRKKRLHHEKLQNILHEETVIFHNQTEEQVLFNETSERLQLYLQRLPEKSQQIYHLNQTQGLNSHAISEKLAIPKKTVDHHLYSVLKFLKKKIFIF